MNNKENIPLQIYTERFKELNPEETSLRAGVVFDAERSGFYLSVLGFSLLISWPDFDIIVENTQAPRVLTSHAVKILALRYLLDGSFVPPRGQFYAYRELPWGSVYDRNFQGRCCLRLSRKYGNKLEQFAKAAESLGGKKLEIKDSSYEFRFLPRLFVRVILREGDDEFAPTAQYLFSDNTSHAYGAEDLAVVGEVIIEALTQMEGTI